jgi:hypothetical protein
MVKRIMYNIDDKFLYEILDDYKEVTEENDKDEILNSFMKLIWSSKNQRNVFQKEIKFKVSNDLLETDTGKIFDNYSSIPYVSYKSMSKDTDFVSLIRQKINNIYTNLCDKKVCMKKGYMDLIKKPKQMYFRWVSGEVYDIKSLQDILNDILTEAELVKENFSKQKMDIKWDEYKKLIVSFFKRMFENFIPLEDYENKNELTLDIDMWNEDNFAVAYLCKGLDGYMKMYQKKYYNISEHKTYDRCECGNMFVKTGKNHKYCPECKKRKQLEWQRNSMKKLRNDM